MASFLDIPTIRTFGIGKVSILCVPEAVSVRALLTCRVLKTSQKRRSWIDICLFCLETRHQCGFMTAHMRKQTEKKDNPRLVYWSFSRIPIFIFENGFFSILTHDFSKTHSPQFLNNKYVCIPKYNYYSILLPLHMPIYFVWCSCTTNLYFLSIEKCAYTYIFIQKLALYVHFYFHALFFKYNT